MLYEPISRLSEPTRHVYTRASRPICTPVTTVSTPVRKSLEKFTKFLNRQNSLITISKKRLVPETDRNSFNSISETLVPSTMAPRGKKTEKNDKNAEKSPKSKAKTSSSSNKTSQKATAPKTLADFRAGPNGTSANDLTQALLALGRNAGKCPDPSEINPKAHPPKTIMIMVHEDTRKLIDKDFWNALKQNPFKQEYKFSMMTFQDSMPPVSTIKNPVEDKHIVGAILLPMFMKSLDWKDPDGTLAEVNLPSRKRKRGFGQGTLADQPEGEKPEEMDTSLETQDFDAQLPAKDAEEIKLVMDHVRQKVVEMSTWFRNFETRFSKCKSLIMISDIESKTVEPAGLIVQSTVLKINKENAKHDYENDFHLSQNCGLVCLGAAQNIALEQVMVRYEEKKHKHKTTDEKCRAFVELQLTRGCRELDQRLKQAKTDEKSAKKLFTEPGACGDPFGDSL